MRRWSSKAAASAPAALLLGAAAAAPFYADGPPPGRTGGFGEATCVECHRGNPVNDAAGRLRLEGLPDAYEMGHTYRLTVTLSRAAMQSAGFQLAVRSRNGRQAGEVGPADDRSALAGPAAAPLRYLQHTRKGTELWVADTARWEFLWQAPAGGSEGGPVVFHLAANAANGDNSPLDDFIFTHEIELLPRP